MGLHRNFKKVWINILLATVMLAPAACINRQVLTVGPQSLTTDTTWQGEVLVNGDVLVEPGATLTIAPGTVIKFKKIDEKSSANLSGTDSPYYPEAELIIRGRLIARGTPEKRIVFTSAETDAKLADWGAINFLGSEGNIIEYAKVLFAHNGIHGHGSEVTVSHSEFAMDGRGISFKKEQEARDAPWFGKPSVFKIDHNQFINNKGGIAFRNSRAEITHNLIKDNKFFGIFPKEKNEAVISYNEITGNKTGLFLFQAESLKLEFNNIHGNLQYNIGVAEAQDFAVEAGHNWFGTIDPQEVDALIFDRKDDPELGEVRYQPLLDKAVAGVGE